MYKEVYNSYKETFGTLIEALTAFTVSLIFVDRETDKSKDKAPK